MQTRERARSKNSAQDDAEIRLISIRCALNYALWTCETFPRVSPFFVERSSKAMFAVVRQARNTTAEIKCLFIYWLLHEMLFHEAVSAERVQMGIQAIHTVAHVYGITVSSERDVRDVRDTSPAFMAN